MRYYFFKIYFTKPSTIMQRLQALALEEAAQRKEQVDELSHLVETHARELRQREQALQQRERALQVCLFILLFIYLLSY